MNTRSLSDDEIQLLKSKKLSSLFPLNFKNGSQFSQMKCYCSICKKEIAENQLHGKAIEHNNMYDVQGIGKCMDCNIYSLFRYRLYDDARFTGLDRTGNWQEWKMQKVSIWKRIIKFLF